MSTHQRENNRCEHWGKNFTKKCITLSLTGKSGNTNVYHFFAMFWGGAWSKAPKNRQLRGWCPTLSPPCPIEQPPERSNYSPRDWSEPPPPRQLVFLFGRLDDVGSVNETRCSSSLVSSCEDGRQLSVWSLTVVQLSLDDPKTNDSFLQRVFLVHIKWPIFWFLQKCRYLLIRGRRHAEV